MISATDECVWVWNMRYGIYSNNGIIPGMTVGPENLNRFVIINPGDSAFGDGLAPLARVRC